MKGLELTPRQSKHKQGSTHTKNAQIVMLPSCLLSHLNSEQYFDLIFNTHVLNQ